ncbi:conserved exported hypothetical protein [uncultured Defluviicoccus sp.]|uniref:Glycoside hydrolase family 42 N-terminal domain-containing protein n=1 Tax=metagenome TaxID=256318 RepID=A0A380T9A6_9ZZZZ|nr:conserved exported hypothetical protein [uncultured Defluviicoccus sp.]
MARALIPAAVIALLVGWLVMPSWAAPPDQFSEYQVIMWQEHTPAEVAGLAKVGFTATKLRGTGGKIDPVELEQRQASGLPWYVENIVTDFLSPYHRYTPGKPNTWLFDDAKARRRADPTDISIFERQPGLSDPEWLSAVKARLMNVVRSQSRYRPLFYNLADEAGIGDLAAAWDADISPTSLSAMRQWLRTQYPDLEALNRQWDTDFGSWEDVAPELTDAAVRRADDNFSGWADFKAWMDVAFARAVRAGTDAVHEADPVALAGLEGGQTPGWGGYDYSLLAPAVDVLEIYDHGDAVELARAFNPGLIQLRTTFGQGLREHHAAWRHLLLGGRGMIVWDERNDVVQPDGQPGPRGRDIAQLVSAMRVVSPELMAAAPSPDAVAVLYSHASFRTGWILEQRARGTNWSDRDAAREYEDNAWRASRRQILGRLREIAVEPRLLSSRMVEGGALRQDGLRVLVLPHAIALSQSEVDEIVAFARRGGLVLADADPGTFDQHSRRRSLPPLAGVAELPEVMIRTGGHSSPEALASLASLLRSAGVEPRADLRGPDGLPATGIEAHWLGREDATILALQTRSPWSAPGQIQIRLLKPAAIEDLRNKGPKERKQQFSLALDPISPTVLKIVE